MNEEDFKRLLNEALEPIKETQKEQTQILGENSRDLENVSRDLENVSRDLENVSRDLENVKVSVATIENTMVAYGDMYKINDSNARKLEKRVETIERNDSITPPPEFTLVEVA